MSQETNQQLVSLDSLNIKALKEVQNKREEQLKIVQDNPFIEITDNETFTTAKKHRTALVSARTSLNKEKDAVISKVKEKITGPLTELYDEFIEITKPHEEKQQTEVKLWEAIKEQERQAKLKAEEDRKQAHRDNIAKIVQQITLEIKNLDYKSSLNYQVTPILDDQEIFIESFEEFGPTLLSELESLKFSLSSRKETLNEQENIRLEKEKLHKERLELERVNTHKQNIANFYNNWINKIYSATFSTILELKKEFNSEIPLSVEEFQPDYEAKRGELVKEFEKRKSILKIQESQRIELEKQREEQEVEAQRLAEENAKKQAEIEAKQEAERLRIQEENKRIEEEKKALQQEKEDLLKNQRITALRNLGFDEDLALNLEHCKIIFPIEDILCSEEEFQDLLNNTKYQIENPPQEENQEDIKEVEYIESPVYEIESINDTHISLIELTRHQKVMQTLLLDFCDYCLSKYSHINQDYIVEFLTRE